MQVYIDAGHRNNAWDYGATSNGYKESELALMVSQEIKTKLQNLGITVHMSRETENDIKSLSERSTEANNLGVDLFLSVHLNAFNGVANGIEVLYYDDPALAALMVNNMCDLTGAVNRGAKQRQDLWVLKATTMEAVLVELGFIDNAIERANFLNDAYRAKLVDGIVDAIVVFYNIDLKVETPTQTVDTEVTSTTIELNGVVKTVDRILKDGTNYIKLRDLADSKIKVDYVNGMVQVWSE